MLFKFIGATGSIAWEIKAVTFAQRCPFLLSVTERQPRGMSSVLGGQDIAGFAGVTIKVFLGKSRYSVSELLLMLVRRVPTFLEAPFCK